MNVKEIFLKKAKLNELSPFYILEPALITVDSQNDLFLFISDFLSSYFKSFNPKTDYSKNQYPLACPFNTIGLLIVSPGLGYST